MSVSRVFRRSLLVLASLLCVFVVYSLLFWDHLPSLPTSLVIHTTYRPDWLTIPLDQSSNINCSKLFSGDEREVHRAKHLTQLNSSLQEQYKLLPKHCTQFLQRRKYFTTVSNQEKLFPIAFTIIMYRDFEQFERLLRAVYRPSNVYCVHVDYKVTPEVRKSVEQLVTCLPHVFIASRALNVQWGTYSVLEAELVCMRDLLKYKTWRYIINLTGQEFPLKTNLQLVNILTAYGGANDIEGTIKRIANRSERWGKAGRPPHNIRPVKGAVHIVANRHFVEYAILNPVANDLLAWVKKTRIPDETFFATLNHNPQLGIPGTYRGEPETDLVRKPFLARYKLWDGGKMFRGPCQGIYVRQVCVFGVGDLAHLRGRKELVANKFHLNYQPVALQCMEAWYDGQVQEEREGTSKLDISYYKALGFVKNKI